jgi:hypothetical protein
MATEPTGARTACRGRLIVGDWADGRPLECPCPQWRWLSRDALNGRPPVAEQPVAPRLGVAVSERDVLLATGSTSR